MSFVKRLWNALGWRLQATLRLWIPGADLSFITAHRLDKSPQGRLESPSAGDEVDADLFHVAGWAFFPGAPTSRVEVRLGDEEIGHGRIGVERPDLKELTDNPLAGIAGFNLTTDLAALRNRSGEVMLRASAVSTAGERLELDPVPLTLALEEREDGAAVSTLPPRPTPMPTERGGRQVLVYTHQLNLGGAQLYLMDLIRGLLKQGTIQLTVVSAMDGSLREDLEDLGIPVHITGPTPMEELSSHLGRLEELARWCEGRDFELVLVNTATALALPGAELANELGIPAVWAIHESFPLTVLWGEPDRKVRAHAEAAIRNAGALLFEAEATRRMFERYMSAGRGHVIPYGLDLEPIDAARETFDHAAERNDAGIPGDAELVVCVGTVEPRKAQLPLVQAFDLIAADHPKAHLALVGGDDKPYSRMIADYIESAGSGKRMELIPITPDVQRWYAMADLLVCASDVESLPRTVLEAMAWETPVLATNVFGLPELIEDGKTGWLCEPRDTRALADALDRVLRSSKDERQRIGRASRELVEKRHSLDLYGQRVAGLIDELVIAAKGSAKATNA